MMDALRKWGLTWTGILLVWLAGFAGASKPKVVFRIHLQTDSAGLSKNQAFPVQLNKPDETIYVSSLSELNEADIVGVESWASEETGLALRLKFGARGTTALNNMTLEHYGRIMVVFLDGRMIYAPVIDGVISNGILTIPRGVGEAEIPLIEELIKKNKS